MSQFTAVIELLRTCLRAYETKVFLSREAKKDIPDVIRFLETAEKVDRERSIKTLRKLYHPRFYDESDPKFPSVDIYDSLMSLVESLPESEEKNSQLVDSTTDKTSGSDGLK